MAARNSSHRLTCAARFAASTRRLAESQQQSTVGDSRPVPSAFLRQVLEYIESTVKAFAQRKGGKVHSTGQDINIRIRSGGGFRTVQVILCGRTDNHKLEVTGVSRNGMETTRTIIELKPPASDLDLVALDKALERALS